MRIESALLAFFINESIVLIGPQGKPHQPEKNVIRNASIESVPALTIGS